LVQGNTCQNWVDEEFKEIKECINTCLKGDNPKLNIDNNIIQMKEINIPIQNVKEDEQQTIPKHVEDSFDESHNTLKRLLFVVQNNFIGLFIIV
jgi:hypothetical protein